MVVQLLMSMGILCIFIGFILFFIGSFMSSSESSSGARHEHVRHQASDNGEEIHQGLEDMFTRTEVRGGGIIMIGPIPIILGTDSKSTQVVILLAIVLMLITFFFFR
ncbi:DUF131 domain-containing protein [uncultured Methanomethylovorans sp.]|uniref:TIGR00304 family membrane protein n=1 Tax=uncultured Methanomethylovorans sp. TaxID=183759 RepID=UPI002AA5F0BF|nr:DUF131 domain-containing protein [uncultured Methanomethylovorans sp.]